MKKLIELDSVLDVLDKIDCSDGVGLSTLKCDVVDDAVATIKALPTVDAVPVRHGRWIAGSVPTYAVCNRCAYQERFAYENNFCPNCGAKMDGKDGDDG